jgi:hypothetical protein
LPVLLFGVLLVLPPGLAMLPVWLAGKPPLFVVPEAALEGAAGAPEPVLPGVLPGSSAFLPQALSPRENKRTRARTIDVWLGRWEVANGGMGILPAMGVEVR